MCVRQNIYQFNKHLHLYEWICINVIRCVWIYALLITRTSWCLLSARPEELDVTIKGMLLLLSPMHFFSSAVYYDRIVYWFCECSSSWTSFYSLLFDSVYVEKEYWTAISDCWDKLHCEWTDLEDVNKSDTFEESPQYKTFVKGNPGHKGESEALYCYYVTCNTERITPASKLMLKNDCCCLHLHFYFWNLSKLFVCTFLQGARQLQRILVIWGISTSTVFIQISMSPTSF